MLFEMTPKHLHLGFHLRGVRSAMIEAAQKDNLRLLIFRPVRLHSVLQRSSIYFDSYNLVCNTIELICKLGPCFLLNTRRRFVLLFQPFGTGHCSGCLFRSMYNIYIYLYIYMICVYTHIYIYMICVYVYVYIYRYVTKGFPDFFFFVCVSGSRFFLPTSRSFASLSNGTDYMLNKCS